MNTVFSDRLEQSEVGTPRLVKVLAMLLLPLIVVGIAACGSAPYAGVPEGKPTNLGSTIPDPKEVVETKPAGQLPDFLADAKDSTVAMYQGAVDNYDSFKYVPCYCGCASYETPHKNLADCFVKERAEGEVTFTDHSLTCDLCNAAAQMTLDGLGQGLPLREVRQNIFEKLSYTGIWTDTPPVP